MNSNNPFVLLVNLIVALMNVTLIALTPILGILLIILVLGWIPTVILAFFQ